MKNLIFITAILAVGLYAYSWHFLVTVFIISFLIFFHELGHFLAARMLGVAVLKFSIGFGDALISKTIGSTKYALSAIPLGGYVQLKGQDDTDPNMTNLDADSYSSKSPLHRIIILFAGPFFNLILAFFIFIALGANGIQKLAPIIGETMQNSAASSAGLLKNDKILSIDNVKISQWDEITKLVKTKPIDLEISRNGEILRIMLTPQIGESNTIFGEKIQKPLIGITPSGDSVELKFSGPGLIKFAFNETYEASKLIFIGIGKLIEGVIPAKEMGGIIQITDATSKAVSIGVGSLLIITALISVNLGVLNLLPIPALDGGHIVFNAYELIFRQKLNQKFYVALTYTGWVLLLSLMVFATYNDVTRLIEK